MLDKNRLISGFFMSV